MALTRNKKILSFVEESAELAQPDYIVWIDGSQKQIDELRKEAVHSGELIKLNESLLPDCYLHRTKVNDVARVEDRTFICTSNREDAGPNNYWMDPREAHELAREIARGSMRGRTMYVIPYSMGAIGSSFARYGIEVTDSIYVVLNMSIMTRVGKKALDAIGSHGDFIKGFHAKCDVDAEKRYILHPLGVKVGDVLMSGPTAEIKVGNCLALKNIPEGTFIHAIELQVGKGAQLARSAGSQAQLMAREAEYAHIKMPSGEIRLVPSDCCATIGQVGNVDHSNVVIGNAGRNRHRGIRPTVRGSAMNAVDHPMGGGRGHGKGGNIPRSPWNQQTRGLKTRSTKKAFGWMIVSDRRKNKAGK